MSKVFFSVSSRALIFVTLVISTFIFANFTVKAADGPTIRSFSGPTELKIGEDGVWKIVINDESGDTPYRQEGESGDTEARQASDGDQSHVDESQVADKSTNDDKQKTTLFYKVTWGDENIGKKTASALASIFRKNSGFEQKTTFSHTYKKSGNYTIKIVVKDEDGKTAETTTTVKVTEEEFKEAKFNAKPDSGKTPLEVVFTVNLGTRTQARIDFGDKSDIALVECDQKLSNERTECDSPIEVHHVYQEAGSYTATLFKLLENERHIKDTVKIRVKTGNPVLDFFKGITDAFQGAFDTVINALFPDSDNIITDREFANLPDINTDEYRSGTRTIDEIEAIVINNEVGDKVTCNLSTGSHTFQAYIITNTNEIGISDCSNTKDVDGYLTTLITNLTLRHAFSGLKLEEMKLLPIYIGQTGEDITEVQDDSDPTAPEEDINKIGFEVKVKNNAGTTVQNWVQGNLTIKSTDSLAFRWDARAGYLQCLPFLADNGSYAITRTNTKMLTGNTENEAFNIYERTGAYYVECKRSSDSSNVHTSVIEIKIDDEAERKVEPPTKDQYSLVKDSDNPLKVTVKRKAPAGCTGDVKYIGEVNWGDGAITRQPQATTEECRDAQTLTESHTYEKAGTYKVAVKLNNVSVLREEITVKKDDKPTQSGALKVTPGSGLSVTLTTNDTEVNKKISDCKYSLGFYGPSGNGLSVNWGDGVTEPSGSYKDSNREQSCVNAVSKHTYQKAGTYTVELTSWHPGPTDAPIIDWKESNTVKVSADAPTENVFRAEPTSGKAELKVTFRFPSNKNATISFGDKSKSRSFSPCVPSQVPGGAGAACLAYREVTHTYEKAGDYNARLITGCPISAGTCTEGAKVETVSITVK